MENPKAHLFLIDYAARRRVKIWGAARVVEDDSNLIARLFPKGYNARPEQAILFTVSAWDVNCRQYIPRQFDEAEVTTVIAEKDDKIAKLEVEIERLREHLKTQG